MFHSYEAIFSLPEVAGCTASSPCTVLLSIPRHSFVGAASPATTPPPPMPMPPPLSKEETCPPPPH